MTGGGDWPGGPWCAGHFLARGQRNCVLAATTQESWTLGLIVAGIGCYLEFHAQVAPQVPLAAEAEDLVARSITALRARHYAYRTEQTYLDWIRRFLAFHQAVKPADLATGHLKSFLEYLAVERNVSSATQNQALSAVLFLYQTVLGHDPGLFEDVIRARRGRRQLAHQ